MSFEWIELPLEDCLDALIDYRGKTPVKTACGIPLITAKIIKNGRIEKASEFIAHDAYDAWMRRGIPKPEDVVLTTEAPLGEVAQLGKEKVALAQRVVTLRGREGLLDSTYLLYLLQTDGMQDQLKARATGTTVLGIKQSELRKVSMRLPPLDMQKSAAAVLAAIDERIDILRDTNATLEAIAQVLFKSWFVDFDPVRAKHEGRMPEGMDEATAGLFPESFEESEFGAVPRGWRASTLGSICAENGGAIQTGPFGSQLHASDYLDAGVPVVMPQDLAGRRVQVDKIARVGDADANRLIRHQVKRGDIVFSRRGDVGRHALVGEREVGWLCGTGCLLVRPGQSWPSFTYLSLALDRAVAKEWLLRHAVGATMPNLNTGILSAVPIMRPDDCILHAFDTIVCALDDRISHGHAHVRTLVDLRDTLLPRLIAGQLRLPGAAEMVDQLKTGT